LRGKRVVIIADADDSGRKHAQQVACSLNGKVQSLKLLELPEAKDLSEWIEKGFTHKLLLALIEDEPEWKSAWSMGAAKAAAQRGRLARAIRAQQAKTFAALN
jgi:DNA primase